MSTDQYDDSAKGGFSYAEKLAQVAAGNMDPKEIGLTSAEEAQLRVLPDAQPERKLGDFITFECSQVPLDIRAQWAYAEEKIIPPDKALWIDEWKEKHKDEIVVQSRIRSGTAFAVAQRTVTNKFLGVLVMMEDAIKLLHDEYQKENATEAEVIQST